MSGVLIHVQSCFNELGMFSVQGAQAELPGHNYSAD